MFWHVYTRACQSLPEVWLATDDARVAEAAEAWKVPCVMTSPQHPSGSDRVEEAARLLHLPDDSIIVNIQGDEPLLEPAMLTELLQPFAYPEVCVATLARPLGNLDNSEILAQAASPNMVKVVMAANGDALYFSRSLIPFSRDGGPAPVAAHIGLYAFRRPTLRQFTALAPTPLEQVEKLEQLRLLEHSIPIRVRLTQHHCVGVDTPEDLALVRKLYAAQSSS